jgi:hypothetical protein
MKGFTTCAEEIKQLFDNATALYKEARVDPEKCNGNPRAQRPNRSERYKDGIPP